MHKAIYGYQLYDTIFQVPTSLILLAFHPNVLDIASGMVNTPTHYNIKIPKQILFFK